MEMPKKEGRKVDRISVHLLAVIVHLNFFYVLYDIHAFLQAVEYKGLMIVNAGYRTSIAMYTSTPVSNSRISIWVKTS
jgi:hypothetical protein